MTLTSDRSSDRSAPVSLSNQSSREGDLDKTRDLDCHRKGRFLTLPERRRLGVCVLDTTVFLDQTVTSSLGVFTGSGRQCVTAKTPRKNCDVQDRSREGKDPTFCSFKGVENSTNYYNYIL